VIVARIIAAALLVFGSTTVRAADCGPSAAASADPLAAYAENEAGGLRNQFMAARERLADCADSEPLWYTVIRASELGLGDFPLTIARQEFADPQALAREAVSRAPRSARIATVQARLDASVASARHAVALDPAWAPAALALASALAAEGANAEAETILAGASGIKSVPGANTTRAAILIGLGKPDQAAALARRDLTAQWPDSPEPFLMPIVRREAMATLGLALLAGNHPKEAATQLKAAAALGSGRAQAALGKLQPGNK
jgi:hypothetical protein